MSRADDTGLYFRRCKPESEYIESGRLFENTCNIFLTAVARNIMIRKGLLRALPRQPFCVGNSKTVSVWADTELKSGEK